MRDSRQSDDAGSGQPAVARGAVRFILALAVMLTYVAMRSSCGHSKTAHTVVTPGTPAPQAIELPKGEQRLCTGVVILIDTSGSMQETVRDRGGNRPKADIARDALERIISYTGDWKKAHPDRMLQIGIYNFSSSASRVLPMAEFDLAKAQAAAKRVPSPGGGTAIGDAIEQGFRELYQAGCVRKHLVCITDGKNTSGHEPEWVSKVLYDQTKGEVELHFVAFDTSASNFGFLNAVNGHVVEAADGEQLQAKLSEIYEKRILAEAMPAEKP